MIARHEEGPDRSDIWARLAALVPASTVQWRQQGKGKLRDGKYFAPFVAYIDAQFVRERLDIVVPGEWDLTLTELPPLLANGDGEVTDEPIAFKARLTILGVIREDVGTGRDYKTAATDAFKRAAVRFGVGHELYTDYEFAYVQVDGDGKYAKALEDPATVYARKHPQQRAASKPVAAEAREAMASPDQVKRLSILADHAAVSDDVTKMVNENIASGITSARADKWIAQLQKAIKETLNGAPTK